jgi:hypothetical protein
MSDDMGSSRDTSESSADDSDSGTAKTGIRGRWRGRNELVDEPLNKGVKQQKRIESHRTWMEDRKVERAG